MWYIQRVHEIIESGANDLTLTKYMIDHQPEFATEYEREHRPTEVQALQNLYHQAKRAEIRRYILESNRKT